MQKEDARSAPKRRNATKGARTREMLKQVARSLFEIDGHTGVTAQSIVETAGISSGTFYTYFKNKDDVISQISFDFLDNMINLLAVERIYKTEFEYICTGHYIYIKYVANNWRFFKFILSYSFVNSNIMEYLHYARLREAERTAAYLLICWSKSDRAAPESDTRGAVKMAMALHAMTEGALQDELTSLAYRTELTDLELREFALYMGRLFYRAAFLEEPPEITFSP